VLARLAAEIAAARSQQPNLALIIGHGSGSFGHTPARTYGTRLGVKTPEQWLGFAEVWKQARALNEIVVAALASAGLPVIAFPPSASVVANDGSVLHWSLEPIQAALNAGLVPLVNGDVIIDRVRGGTILSTEELFLHLASYLRPKRILFAGLEPGVWADFPARTRLVETITPANFASIRAQIGGSASIDVTGGMIQKVESMLALAENLPGFEALIFSGIEAGTLQSALSGGRPGTLIRRE
jgi:isopentenyl phosphate kinase